MLPYITRMPPNQSGYLAFTRMPPDRKRDRGPDARRWLFTMRDVTHPDDKLSLEHFENATFLIYRLCPDQCYQGYLRFSRSVRQSKLENRHPRLEFNKCKVQEKEYIRQ